MGNIETDVGGLVDLAASKGVAKHDSVNVAITGDGDIAATATLTQANTEALGDVSLTIALFATNAVSKVDTAINNAVSKVASIISANTDLAAFINSFESDTDAEFARSVSRFAGGMADINAVMGSAFVLGMGLQERERLNQLTRQAYELKVKMFSEMLPMYLDTYKEAIRTQLQVYLTELTQFIQGSVQYQSMFYKTIFDTMLQYIQGFFGVLQNDETIWSTIVSEFNKSALMHTEGYLGKVDAVQARLMQAISVDHSQRQGVLGDAVRIGLQEISKGEAIKPALYNDYVKTNAAVVGEDINSRVNYFKLYLEKKLYEKKYPIDVMVNYGNALAAGFGATQYTSESSSLFESMGSDLSKVIGVGK